MIKFNLTWLKMMGESCVMCMPRKQRNQSFWFIQTVFQNFVNISKKLKNGLNEPKTLISLLPRHTQCITHYTTHYQHFQPSQVILGLKLTFFLCALLTLSILLATCTRWCTVPHRFAARHSLGAHCAALQVYHQVRIVKNILLYSLYWVGLSNVKKQGDCTIEMVMLLC